MSEIHWSPIPMLEMLAQVELFKQRWPSGGPSIDGSELDGKRFSISLLSEPDANEILKTFPEIDCTAELTIMNSPIAGEGLQRFFGVPRPGLKRISLFNTGLSGLDLAGLPSIPNLIEFETDVTDHISVMVSSLAKHPQLTSIFMDDIGSDGDLLSSLRSCKNLKSLKLRRERTSDCPLENLAFLSQCEQITSLQLHFPCIAAQCFEEISRIPKLRDVTIATKVLCSSLVSLLGTNPSIHKLHCFCDVFETSRSDSSGSIESLLLWTPCIKGEVETFVAGLERVTYLELAAPGLDPLRAVRAIPAAVTELVLRTNKTVSTTLLKELASCQRLKMILINAPGAAAIERSLKALMPHCDVRISPGGIHISPDYEDS